MSDNENEHSDFPARGVNGQISWLLHKIKAAKKDRRETRVVKRQIKKAAPMRLLMHGCATLLG